MRMSHAICIGDGGATCASASITEERVKGEAGWVVLDDKKDAVAIGSSVKTNTLYKETS